MGQHPKDAAITINPVMIFIIGIYIPFISIPFECANIIILRIFANCVKMKTI